MALGQLLAAIVEDFCQAGVSRTALALAITPERCRPAEARTGKARVILADSMPALVRADLKKAVAAAMATPPMEPVAVECRLPLPPAIAAIDAWTELRDELTRFGWVGFELCGAPGARERAIQFLISVMPLIAVAVNRALLSTHTLQRGAPLEIVGQSEPFLQMERQVKRAGFLSSQPVLITGERGTGKELVARSIHYYSSRASGPFVPVITSATPESLQSDDLFGHLRHSFTGAMMNRTGKVRSAERGTLFIDEVGDISPALQLSLLRLAEQGEVHVLGSDMPVYSDTRIVAATNRNMAELIAGGRFREDLFDRLNVIDIRVPSLRERSSDIALLARYFMARACSDRQIDVGAESCGGCPRQAWHLNCASPDFYAALESHSWPGNVRELRNLIIKLATLHVGETLTAEHVLAYRRCNGQNGGGKGPDPVLTLRQVIRNQVVNALKTTSYNQSRAARLLGIPLSTLRHHMMKSDIRIPRHDARAERPASGSIP